MPTCIYCDKKVPHHIGEAPCERSLCVDCLVQLKRFELQNSNEIMSRLFTQDVVDAMKRLKTVDSAKMGDPEAQSQLLADLHLVMAAFPL